MKFQPAYTVQHSEDDMFRVVQTAEGVYAEVRDPDEADEWFDVDDATPIYGSVDEAMDACRKMAGEAA